MILLTQYVVQHELKPLRGKIELQDILEGAEKVYKNLTIATKSPVKLPGFKFFKVRIGRKTKGRMIVFMTVESKKVVPILVRLKKDKIFGMNMAMNNPAVAKQVSHNLNHIFDDIKHKRYEEF